MLTSQLTPREGFEEKEARTALAARESPIQRERRERAKGTPQSMFEHRDDVNPSSPPNVRMGRVPTVNRLSEYGSTVQ
jgi:hypothetical protein